MQSLVMRIQPLDNDDINETLFFRFPSPLIMSFSLMVDVPEEADLLL